MTNPILTKLTKMIDHRADVARRWFRIKDVPTATEFVFADPDVQAHLANPVVANAIARQAVRVVIAEIIDGTNIAGHRRRFGDEFVDHVLAVSAKLLIDGKRE